MSVLRTLLDSCRLYAKWAVLEAATRRGLPASSRRLALFAWALPPSTSAGVHRPLSLIRYGALAGWRVDAFHGETPPEHGVHGDELVRRIPASVRMHQVPDSVLQHSYSLFPNIDGGFRNAVAFADHAIRRLDRDPPSVVLASGPPFFVFVAARFVANRYRVPLVLDYRDEWSECPFSFVSKGPDDRRWEAKCLRDASAVLFTTESHRRHQLERFAELTTDRAHLIPNGWEPDDFPENDSGDRPVGTGGEGRVVNIAHVGTLAGHCPPDAFLAALAQLLEHRPEWRERLRVHFIGRRSPECERSLETFPFPGNLVVVDHLGKKEANDRMRSADALLLIATPELERYLPSKLFDYIAARRPVLVHGAPGEVSTLVDRLQIGVSCLEPSGEGLWRALQSLERIPMAAADTHVRLWLEEHRRDVLAERILQVLQGVQRVRTD